MIFEATSIEGAWVVRAEPVRDERGFFARTWCRNEFAAHGLNPNLVQSSISYSSARGTLRGMHLQRAPFGEAKLVRCTNGVIYDVIIDLRPGSSTFKRHFAVELASSCHNALYVPEGCAHGFLTLTPDTEVLYQMSQFYSPESATGVRWNDPSFAVEWPEPVRVISTRDAAYPDFSGTN